jgi:hypothetical protein
MHRELFEKLQQLNDSDEHEVKVAMMSIDTLKKLEAELLHPFRSVMTK